MRVRSLSSRLFFTAAFWSTIALVVAGFVLTALYQTSVEKAFDERLGVYLKTLVGTVVAESDPSGKIDDPGSLGEPRFELPLSGWYWQVGSDKAGAIIQSSGSLLGDTFPMPSANGAEVDETRTWRGYVPGPDDEELRVLEREITFDAAGVFRIAVAGNADEVHEEVSAFRDKVAITLAALGVGLVIAVIFQVQVGLKPLERMRTALYAIRTGEADRLKGDFPSEIEPLAIELNALIESNREVVERARTHVGNLAHALKTPLTIIVNEARSQKGPLSDKVLDQSEQMREQITRHLERARMAAQRRVIGIATDVETVSRRLIRAMRRINDEKDIDIELVITPGLSFRGEQQDFEEMLGNLVDNACKWASAKVRVSIERSPVAKRDHQRGMLSICVDDDGPGLTPEQRDEATKRGRRLDETVPGSGLGLSIVTELAELYGGRFHLDQSPLGGLRASLTLPAL